MAQALEEIIKNRLDKLQKLVDLGVDPFPPYDRQWKKMGRISAIRGHGKLFFIDIVGSFGKQQLSFKADKLGKLWELVGLLDLGDFIGIDGDDYLTEAGEPTIEVTDFSFLTKSLRPLPSEWYGFKDIEEKYRQRYVDLLMNADSRKVFETRSKIIRLLREKLTAAGFMELETPILQPIYGGASAKPFTTYHHGLDTNLYLRISDELYLKRLIVGGFDKVYEIGKDFRNEGVDRQHNPEFTMLEFYWAYASYEDLMKFTEELLSSVVKEITGNFKIIYEGNEYNFELPWKRITFRDLVLADTGVDIDIADTEEKLLGAIADRKLSLNLDGVFGFGALCDALYKNYSRPKIVEPTFVMDYPMAMLPLAKRVVSDPRKAASFQLLVGGFEFIKAYNELNDPVDQKKRWEEEMKLASKGLSEHQVLDEDYIRALEYGMPPTAGWGMGIDRFTAFLTDQHTIKDTILFPVLKSKDEAN